MSLTPSTMLPLGTPAADFFLADVTTGKKLGLLDFDGLRGLLVTFISRHCPYVQHVKKELGKLGIDYAAKGIAIVAISSNDVAHYPDDAPDLLKAMAREEGYNFPILYDPTQEIAKAYTAACTPDFFLFDAKRKLVYRGELDDSRPGNGKPVNGKELRAALDALIAGNPVPPNQKPSMGCNIKWKPGQAPAYFH
jgi:peroxiredoxin